MKYEEIDALNWSTLKLMDISPAYCKHAADHPEEFGDKESYKLGRCEHCAILEPDEFDKRYIVQPDFGNMATNAAKEEKLDWMLYLFNEKVTFEIPEEKLSPGKLLSKQISFLEDHLPDLGIEVITKDEYDASWRASAAVRAHKHAIELINGASVEHTVQWKTKGIKSKGRLDLINERVIDLKSTRRNTLREIIKDAANYDYHGQCAWYHDGAVKAGLINGDVLPAAIFVHAPKGSKFVDVAVLSMGLYHDTLEAGRELYEKLLMQYMGCQAANWWPGMATEVMPWELPAYKMEG